jgi:hypothetical protein
MDLVLKISHDYTAANTLAQIINPMDLKFSEELVNTGSLSFKIGLDDEQIAAVIEYKKVALYVIENGGDNLMWHGYIEEPENDFGYVVVKCQDEKDFLRNKIITSDRDFTSTDVTTGLTDILTEINGRRGPNEPAFTFTTDIGATIINKKFTSGTSIYDILKEISDALDAEWRVDFCAITFNAQIGTDRTISGDDYVEFIWNNTSPNENNITNFKNTRKGKEIATLVVGRDPAGGTATIVGDNTVFGSIERAISMDEGNVSTQTQEYVDKHEVSQIEREFTVNVDEEKARTLQVGDTVKVKVIHGSVLADVDANLRVIQKSATFENKKPNIKLKLSTEAKEITSMANFLSQLNRRVKRFELY